MKSRKLLYVFVILAALIAVILILTLFIPVLRKPAPPLTMMPQQEIKKGEQLPEETQFLFEKKENFVDPFTSTSYQNWKLREELEQKANEIELLKLELERAKLIKELRELRGEKAGRIYYRGKAKDIPVLLATSLSENSKRALLLIRGEKRWVKEGGSLEGYRVMKIVKGKAILKTPQGKVMELKVGGGK